MEHGYDHGYSTESYAESSCSKMSSKEIPENETTLEDEIYERKRNEQRRTKWEDLFEHVRKYIS